MKKKENYVNEVKIKIFKRLILKLLITILCIQNVLVLINIYGISEVKADSYRYTYNGGSINYPGYKERIDAIKNAHPNWNFVIMETGLDWNQVISAEYSGHFDTPKNLIQGKQGGWICSICGSKVYDTGEWMCASEAAIKYYMDPRNWLVDSPYLFQFLQTDYMEASDNDVYSSLNGTFLYSWENATTINKVCREKNASPYFIIARLLQEQGTGGGMTYRMQDWDGTIYYNLFNIGASGNTMEEVYNNALAKAKENNWTSIEKCLSGGISFLMSSYIAYKQNTLYLNKFDVETYMGTYVKQYMQNIEAPKSEGLSMYNKMKNANLLEKNLTFIVPVYENMPELACSSPDQAGEAFPKNIRVKEGHYGIMIRAGRSTSSTILGRINDSNTVVLSVERFSDGWHKIVLESGLIGYVKFNTDYLEEINDITNCYENKTVKNDGVILRTGPGLAQVEITTLAKGQVITRIDNSGRYNFEGNIWDRVVLIDGRQGFVARDSLKDIDYSETFKISANGGLYMRDEPEGERIRSLTNGSFVTRVGEPVTVNGNTWEKVVSQDGTIGYVARNYLRDNNGEIPNQNENNTSQNETEQNEINEGIANEIVQVGDANETNNNTSAGNEGTLNEIDNGETGIEENGTNENNVNSNTVNENKPNENDISSNTTNENGNTTNSNTSNENGNTTNSNTPNENGTTTNNNETNENSNNTTTNENNNNEIGENNNEEENERKYLVISPEKMAKDLEGIVTKAGIQTEEAGTGYKIIIKGEEYTIVKKGDANGDGYVKANDYLIIKDYIIGREGTKLEGEYLQAADVTNDKAVKANDYLKIKDHIMYGVEI